MELNPFAALMNNAVGTFTIARTALAHGCEFLVLLSTDKAVRPHSIMGASKRLDELITISLSQQRLRTYVGLRNLAATLDLLASTVAEYVPSQLMLSGKL